MRPLALVLLLVAALAALAPTVSGAVSFEPSMAPERISWSPGREIVYRLRMTTGAQAESFGVSLVTPGWRPSFLNYAPPLGQPISPVSGGDALSLEGPGWLGTISEAGGGFGGAVCTRGYDPNALAAEDISLPANSTSTLVARYRMSFDSAPFPDTDLRVTFVAAGGTLAGEQSFRPAEPQLQRPYGVRIGLATRPRSRFAGGVRPLRLRRGRRIDIHGTAHGVRRGVITLRHTRPGSGARLRTLARVRTDGRERFRYRGWRPRRRGLYEVVAVYGGAGRRLTRDRSCFRAFVVR